MRVIHVNPARWLAILGLGIALVSPMPASGLMKSENPGNPGNPLGRADGGVTAFIDLSRREQGDEPPGVTRTGGSKAPEKCFTDSGHEVDCHHHLFGPWNAEHQRYCDVLERQPPRDHFVWQGRTDGVILQCYNGPRVAIYLIWAPGPPDAGPTPQEIAERAIAKINLRTGTVHTAPPELERIPDAKVPFGFHIWLALARGENTTGPITASATDGGLTVTISAELIRTDWELRRADPGTQGRLIAKTRCEGPNAAGTIYEQGMIPSGTTTSIHSPTCDFNNTSYKKAGHYTITAHSTWKVTWTANTGQTGTYELTTPPTFSTINIVEYQALNTLPDPYNTYPPLQEQDSQDK